MPVGISTKQIASSVAQEMTSEEDVIKAPVLVQFSCNYGYPIHFF